MEIKTYSNQEDGATKVFFVVKDNLVMGVKVGNQVVSVDTGFQFFVDDYVAEQIDKCELFLDGFTAKLRIKEGETLDVPGDEDKERRIAELQRELERLQGE